MRISTSIDIAVRNMRGCHSFGDILDPTAHQHAWIEEARALKDRLRGGHGHGQGLPVRTMWRLYGRRRQQGQP